MKFKTPVQQCTENFIYPVIRARRACAKVREKEGNYKLKMLPSITTFLMMVLFIEPRCVNAKEAERAQRYPNIVVMVADDLGIGDLGCYGNNTIKTPNIDKLAAEGVKLNHHLAVASMCTPSRAGLLTGRYPARYGLVGDTNTPSVISHIASRVGLPFSEVTLAKALSSINYSTALVGKWHLGLNCGIFGIGCNAPQMHGFQQFYGIPLSLYEGIRGDHPFWIFPLEEPFYQALSGTWLLSIVMLIIAMIKFRMKFRSVMVAGKLITLLFGLLWLLRTHYCFHKENWWDVSVWMDQHMNGLFMNNSEVIELPLNMKNLDQKLMNYTVQFIQDHTNDKHPFFLCHAFPHVHTPLFAALGSVSKSKHGRYGDDLQEMDKDVGIIMETLKNLGLDENTIVYFVSDHGGHLEAIDENGQRIGGHNGLFKGGKGQGVPEGAIRVPGIYRWKGQLPHACTVDTPTSLMDMMPTILDLAGLPPLQKLMPHRALAELDGINIAKLLKQEEKPESRVLLHHCERDIHGVRWSNEYHIYKMFLMLHKFHENSTQCGWGAYAWCSCYDVVDISDEPLLFDLMIDPFEESPIPSNTSEYKEAVEFMKSFLSEWRSRIHYPPSQMSNKWNTMHAMWLQPSYFSNIVNDLF